MFDSSEPVVRDYFISAASGEIDQLSLSFTDVADMRHPDSAIVVSEELSGFSILDCFFDGVGPDLQGVPPVSQRLYLLAFDEP